MATYKSIHTGQEIDEAVNAVPGKIDNPESKQNGQVLSYNSTAEKWEAVDPPAGGVTNINTGAGLSGGPITSTGTISLSNETQSTLSQVGNKIDNPSLKSNGQVLSYNSNTQKWEAVDAPASGVISVTAGDGLTGGTITESGTIALDRTDVATSSKNGLMSGADKVALGNKADKIANPTAGDIVSVTADGNIADSGYGTEEAASLSVVTSIGDSSTDSQVPTAKAVKTAINSAASGVTNIATGAGLSGGPITSTGTISLDETYIADSSHSGLMSSNDKSKLDSLETVAISGSYNDLHDVPNIPSTLSDLTPDSLHRTVTDSEKTLWTSKGTYSKPDSGIPKSDMSSAVQASLTRADTAIQTHQDISSKADKTTLNSEISARTNADVLLQQQIDAITSQSDVVDIVGTYAELVSYGKPIYKDDIVKVLSDNTHSDALSYYRVGGTVEPPAQPQPPYTWIYIGSEGPFATISQVTSAIGDKMDKVPGSISGNIPIFDGSGGIEDSECSVIEATGMNITAVISATSTDSQIPTAKAIYNSIRVLSGGDWDL